MSFDDEDAQEVALLAPHLRALHAAALVRGGADAQANDALITELLRFTPTIVEALDQLTVLYRQQHVLAALVVELRRLAYEGTAIPGPAARGSVHGLSYAAKELERVLAEFAPKPANPKEATDG